MIISIGMSEPAKRNKQQTKKMKEPDDLEVTSSLKVPVDKFPGNLDDVAILIKKRMIPFCTTVLLKRHRKRWSFREFESSYRL